MLFLISSVADSALSTPANAALSTVAKATSCPQRFLGIYRVILYSPAPPQVWPYIWLSTEWVCVSLIAWYTQNLPMPAAYTRWYNRQQGPTAQCDLRWWETGMQMTATPITCTHTLDCYIQKGGKYFVPYFGDLSIASLACFNTIHPTNQSFSITLSFAVFFCFLVVLIKCNTSELTQLLFSFYN